MFEARLQIVREAIHVVLRRLEGLGPSDKTEEIRMGVEECLREASTWNASPPAPPERDALMKRVLALHVEVTRLEQDAPLDRVHSRPAACTT